MRDRTGDDGDAAVAAEGGRDFEGLVISQGAPLAAAATLAPKTVSPARRHQHAHDVHTHIRRRTSVAGLPRPSMLPMRASVSSQCERDNITTRAPSSTNRTAMAWPKPRDAPEITATLPAKRGSFDRCPTSGNDGVDITLGCGCE